MENQRKNIDEVLDKFSMFGRYHLEFMLFAFGTYVYNGMFAHTFVFAAEKIGYRCKDEVFSNNTCGSVNGVRCSEWIYDNPDSFMAEFNLACQEWKWSLIGTVHSFGYMLGLLITGPSSDSIGRKNTFLWTGVLGAMLGVTKSLSHSYWLYLLLEFLGSVLGDNYLPFYILNLEIISAKKRVIYHFICHLGTMGGGVVLALLAWGIPYWRFFLQAIYAPAFLFLGSIFIVDESPRWLLSKGKKDKAITIVRKMGRKNKVILDEDILDKLSVEDDCKSMSFISQFKLTIKCKTLLKRFLVCVVWWTVSSFVYHGLVINAVFLQGNRYINYGLTQFADSIGNCILMYVLHKYQRRIPLMCTFFAAALLWFIQPLMPNGYQWLSIIIYMVSSLLSSMYFGITYIYTSELFPTYTRNSMHSLCSSTGRIGAMLAPQTPLLLAYWSGLPALVFGGASLAAGLATLLVPESAGAALPDTVHEAERLGRRASAPLAGRDNLAMTTE